MTADLPSHTHTHAHTHVKGPTKEKADRCKHYMLTAASSRSEFCCVLKGRGLLSAISLMMCRYAAGKTQLVCTAVPEGCLLFSGGSEEGLGGGQRWGLRNVYETSLQRIHVTSVF